MADDEELPPVIVGDIDAAPETVIEGDVVIVPPSEPETPPDSEATPAELEAAHDAGVVEGATAVTLEHVLDRVDSLADMLVEHIEAGHEAEPVIEPAGTTPTGEVLSTPEPEPVVDPDAPIERDDEIAPRESRVHPLFRSRSDWREGRR